MGTDRETNFHGMLLSKNSKKKIKRLRETESNVHETNVRDGPLKPF